VGSTDPFRFAFDGVHMWVACAGIAPNVTEL
jgi:hypothetical protein